MQSVLLDALLTALQAVQEEEQDALDRAAVACAAAIEAGGIMHTFGTGHSSSLVVESFFRAGGLACVNAMLETPLWLSSGAELSTWMERQDGYAEQMFARYDCRPGEPLIVFSNSGVNAVPVQIAALGKARGMTVVAVTSREYCEFSMREHGVTTSLLTIADIVIDNHTPVGDAVIPVPGTDHRIGALSTAVGATIYQLLVERITTILSDLQMTVPYFLSANMPGAAAHNRGLINRYRPRIRHL